MKNKITFLILFIVLGFCSLQAQVTQKWVARYNGTENGADEARYIAVDGLGNVYVTGRSSSGTGSKYVTVKYNSSGDSLWIARYSGPGNFNIPTSLVIDNAGNVYVTGESTGTGTGIDYATIKYNSTGDSLWVARYNGPGNNSDYAVSLAVDGSGNVYVTGSSNGDGTYYDYTTIKYNSSGVQQWVQRYDGGNGGDAASSLAIDDSGNVYVTGSSWGETHIDYATIKYNSSGDSQWVQRYNGPTNIQDYAFSLAVDGSGNVYVTGQSPGIGTSQDFATIKYNSSGVQQWIQRDGLADVENSKPSLAVDNSGNVYLTGGLIIGSGTNTDYATIKYNSSGVMQWIQAYDGPGNSYDIANSIAVDGSGNIYVTGISYVSTTSSDYATIKYNSSGVQQWVQSYNGPGNGSDAARFIAVDNLGNVYVTGLSTGSGTDLDYATIKYSQTDGISAPSNLTAQSVDSSFIKVNWQDNSNDEDGFYIERTQINDSSHWEVIDVVPQNVNQYTDYFVTRALKYFYRVKAYSGNTYSEYSNIDSAILGGNPAFIPAAPSNLVLIKRTASTITMDWHDNSNNENGFIIFRKTEGDLFFRIVDSVGTDVVTYQEVGLSPNLDYSYKICSFNAYGISDYSNTLIVLAKPGPFIRTPEPAGNHVLSGNYPNPFNPVTKINYELRITNYISLKVYDILGNEVFVLVNETQNAGTYSVDFDGSNFSSGVYFYKLHVGEFVETRKMTLIK